MSTKPSVNIATINPVEVRNFKPGTFFYCHFDGYAQLAMVCASEQEPAEARMILKLPDALLFSETDMLAFKEEQHRVAVPLVLASVETTPSRGRLDSGSGAADGVDAIDAVDFVIANAKGYWVRNAPGYWANLATGLVSERAPSAPWVELGDVRLLDSAGNVFAEIAAVPSC